MLGRQHLSARPLEKWKVPRRRRIASGVRGGDPSARSARAHPLDPVHKGLRDWPHSGQEYDRTSLLSPMQQWAF